MLAVDFSDHPRITTSQLVLDAIERTDIPALFAMRSDPRVMAHIGRPLVTTVQEASELFDRIVADRSANQGITWAMRYRIGGEMIGTIGYYRLKPEHHLAEVGYLLGVEHWGKGLMTEALDAVVGCGFDRFHFHRIEAITALGNAASRHLLEKCGFQLEGILRENYHFNGAFEDSCVFGRLRDRQGIPIEERRASNPA